MMTMRVDDLKSLLNCQASPFHTTFSLLKESTLWLSSEERSMFPKRRGRAGGEE